MKRFALLSLIICLFAFAHVSSLLNVSAQTDSAVAVQVDESNTFRLDECWCGK